MYLVYLIILVISSNNRLFFKGTELLQLLFLHFTGVLHFKEDLLNCLFTFYQMMSWGYGHTEIMSATCLEIFGLKKTEKYLLDYVFPSSPEFMIF